MSSRKIATFAVLAILFSLHLGFSEEAALEIVRINDRSKANGPKVLAILAHPDDETVFAASLYKTSTHLNGSCDILLITNGEGGFKYSTLAESLYGLELTKEEIGRKELPAIRKKEFVKGCRYMKIRQAFFLNQKDHRYSLDPNEVFKADPPVWDLKKVKLLIDNIVSKGDYDYVFTHLPVSSTHAHHKCASILALESLSKLPESKRPTILGAQVSSATRPAQAFLKLDEFPATEVLPKTEFRFDRRQSFGYKNKLNYKIVVDWVISEHKSQGTMQLYAHQGDEEVFYFYKMNSESKLKSTETYFNRLKEPQFQSKTYGPSAGIEKKELKK